MQIYKLAGKLKVTGVTPPFTDVPANASYYNAVAWAYSNGIISGTTATNFSPMASCRRCQMVVFLEKFNRITHYR